MEWNWLLMIELVEQQFDVVHYEGKEAVCRCPWHNDSGRPNLYVNTETGLYICFSCGAKGKADLNKPVSTEDNLHRLRNRLKKLGDTDENPVMLRSEDWLNQFDHEHPYWSGRGFSERTIKSFGLGWSPITDTVTIPIRDSRGRLLGVIHRVLDGSKPKYLHPKGFQTGRNLFGSWLIGGHKKVAIVEGPLDAIACWDAGVPAVAAYGSRLTTGQAELVKKLGVTTLVVMTDNDLPGREAVLSIKKGLTGVGVYVGVYEPHWSAKDPGELSKVKRKQMYYTAVPFHTWKKRV